MRPATSPPITPNQMREARSGLGWTRQNLSRASGITEYFIRVYEQSGRVSRLNLQRSRFDGLVAIRTALELAGAEFAEGDVNGLKVKTREKTVAECQAVSECCQADGSGDVTAQIAPQQMHDARLLLGWSRERLAGFAGTTGPFVYVYETEGRVMRMFSRERSLDGLAAIRATLEAAGIEFMNGAEPGVKLKRQSE